MNCWRAPWSIGPRQMTAAFGSSSRNPMLMSFIAEARERLDRLAVERDGPPGDPEHRRDATGRRCPRRAGRRESRRAQSAMVRLVATELLPTPPLPLITRTMFFTPGSGSSAPTARRAELARGACREVHCRWPSIQRSRTAPRARQLGPEISALADDQELALGHLFDGEAHPSRPRPESRTPPYGIESTRNVGTSLTMRPPTCNRANASATRARESVKTPACRP